MREDLHDPIEVGVRFSASSKIEPVWFFWKGKKYDIKDSKHRERKFVEGSPVHHFSVLSNDHFYHLTFNGEELKWELRKIWSEEA